MFNRSQFNRMPFNRPYSVEILFSATLEGHGSLTTALNLEFNMATQLDGQGELIADFIREIFLSLELDGVGTMDVEMIRERFMAAVMNGEGSLQGDLSRYRVEYITIPGPFIPGDKLTIDAGKLRVNKNGQPVTYTGDFYDIHPGQNAVTYTDQASGRTIQIRITHRDKFLY